ncbi:MAG: HAD family hydrolase [Acutalibacteraceae bacterium]|nr:HAD family hydrolase [Acutalibacteraceae bacterium]
MLNTDKRSKYKCVVWDWNGTIIDDIQASLLSVNDMLIKRNLPVINLQQYHSYLDTPIYKFYEHIFDLDKIPFDIIQKEFNEGYNKHISSNPLNDGVVEIMELLEKNNVKQVVVSSSHQDIVESGAKRFDVSKFLECISGSYDNFVGSKVERAINVISKITKDYSQVVVIGDTLHDCQLANEIGADCILLSTGHQSKDDLLTTGKPVINSLKELIKYLF